MSVSTEHHPKNELRRRLRIVVPAYPAFNIYSGVASKMTALGPVCVATALQDVPGWDVEIIDENNYQRGAPADEDGMPEHAALQELRPADAVGLYGGLTSTIPRLLRIAGFYQEQGVPTIAGGQHFVEETSEQALRNGVDFLVRGEGENAIKELLECVEGRREPSEVDGISYLEGGEVVSTPDRPQIEDLDCLPVPDYGLLRYADLQIYPVGRVRGCGMDCEFCTVKGRPRYASAERLVEQFASLYEKRGAKSFFVVDDLFGQDRAETLRLCRMLADYQESVDTRFRIMVQIRLDKARDEELLSAMREASINRVAIGFESPIAEELEAMNKRLRPEQMVELARTYHRAGFSVHGMFIFGYPMREGHEFRMDADERVKRFKKFIRKARIDTLQVLLPVPLPGTELRNRLQEDNRVYSTDIVGWEYYDGNFPLFEPDEPMTAEDMHKAVREIMGSFYRGTRVLNVAVNLLTLPSLVFHLHNLRAGWQRWYRSWLNNVVKFGGWRILRKWRRDFRKDDFSLKLSRAKREL